MTFSPDFYKNILNVDPLTLQLAIEGGIAIAIAASLYYSFFGFILGMSGLIGNCIKGHLSYDARRSFTIIAGLIFSSAMVLFLNKKKLTDFYPFDKVETGSNTHLAVAGLLVGVGTQLGSGCTSGHGLCGLPRLSLRSISSVMIFLITGIITATFNISNLIPKNVVLDNITLPSNIQPIIYLILTTVLPLVFFAFSNHKNFSRFFRTIIYFFIGTIFGFGLMLAGMSQRSKIYAFLELNKNWDPSLLFVLMTGVVINLVIFTIMRKGIKKPLMEENLSDPRGKIDWKLLIGAFLFGLGWGIGGLCPGPFLLLIPQKSLKVLVFWGVPLLLGMRFMQFVNKPAGVKEVSGKQKVQ